jgi:8-oxo-dGTP diphosphatase
MTPTGETAFEPNDETDDVRWVTPDEARRMLSYDRDRDVLAAV